MTSFVRGVRARTIGSTTSPAARTGYSMWTVRSVAPPRSHTAAAASVTAPYARSVITTSSPALKGTDPSTAFKPVVTLGTNTRSSGREPRNAATWSLASRRRDTVRHGMG